MWILLTLKSVEIIFIYIIRPPLLCSRRILQSAAFYHKGTSLSPPRLPRCATDGCELSVLCFRFRSFFISMNWLCLRHKPTFQSLRRNSERNTLAVSFVSWEWPGRESGWDGNFSWNEFIERIIQRPHPECLGQFGCVRSAPRCSCR